MDQSFHRLAFGMIFGEDQLCLLWPSGLTLTSSGLRAHRKVLHSLGVRSIAAVVGGSMGGMAALEWPLCTPTGYVKAIIPVATSADHCAWGISWAEAQRQCIYADPKFDDGYYDPIPAGQPSAGLAAARMVAMLTYRSYVSFDTRFGRKPPPQNGKTISGESQNGNLTACEDTNGVAQEPKDNAFRSAKRARLEASVNDINEIRKFQNRNQPPTFSAQGYLKYQGEKFVRRFDANCYIHLTHKMDTHDITRERLPQENYNTVDGEVYKEILKDVPPRALVISVDTDALFHPEQQAKLATYLPDATLAVLKSPHGHDGFLLEFEALNDLIAARLKERCPWVYEGPPRIESDAGTVNAIQDCLVGEAESQW